MSGAPAARRNVERIYPLSPLQQGMVFESMVEPDTDAYSEQLTCQLRGPLDIEAFRQAWAATQQRHEALRTSVHWTAEGKARQVVHRELPLRWHVHDLTDWPAAEVDAAVEALWRADRASSFDLTRAPLFRLTLARVSDDDHRLAWSNHHVVLDGWSRAVVFADVLAAYAQLADGRPVVADPAAQYGDFIAWLGRRDAAADTAFWSDALAGVTGPTPLPGDRSAGAGEHVSRTLQLPAQQTGTMAALGRANGITLASIVHAAWALLLARHAGDSTDDVVFGTTVTGRPPRLRGVESMVGLFINTVPVRVRVDPAQPVLDWLRDVQGTLLELREHEHTPLVDIPVAAGGGTLIRSLLVVENYPLDTTGTGALTVEQVRADERTHYPLMLVVAPGETLQLRLLATPPSDALDERDAERSCAALLDQLATLLGAIAADPAAPVRELPLHPPAGEHAALAASNPAPRAIAERPALVSRFVAHARRRPDAIAVADGESCLSYRALYERAQALAQRLRASGVGTESLVGILVDRGAAQVVAVLAVHLAGGAYLPLDLGNPADRLRWLLADSGAGVVVTSAQLRSRVEATGLPVATLLIDDVGTAAPTTDQVDPRPAALAYVIYTSGSTGRPKGVQVTHGNAARLFDATSDWLTVTADDRWSLFHSVAFDFSVWELWGALAHGGRLEIVGDDARHDAAGVAAMLDERAITVLSQTPSAFGRLADAQLRAGHIAPQLRHVVFGGEALHPDRLADWRARFPEPDLINMYGITETTVHVTAHRVEPADMRAGRSVIGLPLPDLRLYLLDAELRPLPPGVTGELYVGGAGVARGYGAANASAQRFVPNPFAAVAGARMYRTGDLARLRADGRGFDYVGRADGQVKLRGYRIELAEIEAALQATDGVRDAATVLRTDEPGEARIVGYVVAEHPSEPDLVERVFAHARDRLAAYMVPAAVVVLDALPLTVNGKLDRAALPMPRPALAPSPASAAPQGETEARLAAIWQQVLGVPAVDRRANFFTIGGHSLVAAQAMVLIRAEFGTPLALRTIFDAPTLAELAVELDRTVATAGRDVLAAGRRPERLPLTFGQQRIWFFDQWQPGSPVYNITSGLRLTGRLRPAALRAAFIDLVDRHESLRTVFRDAAGRPEQVVLPPGRPDFAVLDLSAAPAGERDTLVDEIADCEATRPFDLAASTPLRVRLLRLADGPAGGEHVLLVTVHHIVADGGSLLVLLRELSALYIARITGVPSGLAPLAAQYADYAVWQRAALDETALEAQLRYWDDQLAGAPPALEVPGDHPRPATLQYAGASVPFTVGPAVRARLDRLCAQTGATTFMGLLAAFQVVLARHSGQRDVVVGTAIEQRPIAGAETLIGLFTNTLVIRTEVDESLPFTALLARVRQVCLDAFAHQDVPFEQLVERLRPERDLSRGPLVQVACNYQRRPAAAADWPEVQVRPLANAPSPGTTKFDLTLNFFESDETLAATLEYNTSLFEPATAHRLVARLLAALDALTAEPGRAPAGLDLLDDGERRRLLEVLPVDAAARVCPPRRLENLIGDHVAATPDAVALVSDDGDATRHYTYAALASRARDLAGRMRALGAGPAALVGLHLRRGPEQVIALLATQLCGAAHVPLDPTYPSERLAFVLADCRPRLVVTRTPPDLPADPPAARILDLGLPDATMPDATLPERADPPTGRSVDQPAYVIYTSGSTGRPKGTVVTHRGLAALSAGQHDMLHAHADSRVLQFASPSFDASVFETVLALTNGATLVLAGGEATLPGPELYTLLDEQAVTWTVLPPTALAALPIDGDGAAGALPALQMLCTAGEALPPALVARWAAGREFHNLYGPTETTVIATSGRCRPGEDVTIGRPFAQSACHVLDAALRPAPIGVPGELYVGGPGVADGYLGRPGLSAERFVPDPFGSRPGARLYRTGDKVRWTPAGRLEFLGRYDHQVKLRGFRIEPGEIEALLLDVPGIREAIVVLRDDSPAAPRLVAYVGSDDPTAVDGEALREQCATRLPDHLVPAVVVALDRLPVGPTGKIDRAALPVPGEHAAGVGYEAPASPLEQQLAQLWADVLGQDRVGRHDNFFTLGGDSIISIQVVSRARRAGLRLAPKLLFRHPTVAELAAALDSPDAPTAAAPTSAPPTAPTSTAPTTTTPATSAMPADVAPEDFAPTPVLDWFLGLELPDRDHFDQSVLLRPRARLDPEILRVALIDVLARHDALRLRLRGARFDAGGPMTVPLEVADHTGLDAAARGAELQRLAQRLHGAVDLGAGRVFAAGYVLGDDGDDRLLLVAHHAAVDSVSWRIVLEDLAEACAARAAGLPVDLPAPATSFAQWAARLAGHARAPRVTSELPHWMSVVEQDTPLPRDRDGVNSFGASATVAVDLSAELTTVLRRVAQLGTPAELLLAATGRALAAWTGHDRALVDIETHGREEFDAELDLSRTVGWFTSIHPVAVPAGHDQLADLEAMRAQLRVPSDHGLGFGLLRPALRALRSGGDPEVAVNYLGQLDQSFTAEGPWVLVDEQAGHNVDPAAPRPYLLDVVALVSGGRMRVRITYGSHVHAEATIQGLLDGVVANLHALVGSAPPAGPETYPLSPMQTGMLFHALRDAAGDEPPYVVQLGGRLTGDLDVAALRTSWERVVARHAVLRTSIHWDDLDRPVQVVHPDGPSGWLELDWRGLDAGERDARLEAFLRADSARGFDLTSAPLVRITVLRLAEEAWHLVWTNHHIIVDGWSLPILMQELFGGYRALRDGQAFDPPAPAPFANYLTWLGEQDGAEAEQFWRKRLSDLSAATPLPPEPGRALAATGGANGQVEVRLDQPTSAQLRALARLAQATLSTVVAAAWAVLLAGHGDERRVGFGLAVSGRPPELADVESMVGMFVNTVPARIDARPDATVESFLRGVHAELVDIQEHAYSPLPELHRYSAVPNGLPLFESLVAFENYPVAAAVGGELGELRAEQTSARDQTNFALTLTAAPGERLPLWLSYQRSRYTDDTARRLLARLGQVLTAFAAAPDAPVRTIDLLPAPEHAELELRNPPCRVGADESTLDELFVSHAAAAPDAVAVVDGERHVTYGALERASAALAADLAGHGVGAESRVGLVLNRGGDYVAAVLAVARVGAAYVPIDPDYPAHRREQVLADAGAHLVVTDLDDADLAGLPAGTPVLRLRRARGDAAPVITRARADNLAYVTYTSGSTGTPKGVQITRGNLAAAAAAWRADYALTPDDRHLQMASVAFDVCTGDLARALTSGATLVLCPKADLLDPRALATRLDEQSITCAEFVPVVLGYLTEHLLEAGRTLPRLRLLISGSDAWAAGDYARSRRVGSADARVLNSYGITEATIDSMFYEGAESHQGAMASEGGPVDGLTPVGRPMSHAQAYVLDAAGRPAPPGVAGELVITGPGVGRGYWGRPGATAERFVPDPFGPAGARGYRSGDRARWDADGQLEFLGRADDQIKLHGYRIEPGQIEAVLADDPDVHGAVVVVRPDAAGAPRLVGYVVLSETASAETRAAVPARLRAAAEQQLPAHERPSALVVLEDFPLTPNGKLDRRALPAPAGREPGGPVQPAAAPPSDPPRTPAELALAAVWQHALGVSAVGRADNFFGLGGDSIISLQVVSRAARAGWSVTSAQIFDRQTLAELAAVAIATDPAGAARGEQGVVTGAAPLTPIQADFLLAGPPAPHHFDQSVLLRASEPIDLDALDAALHAVLTHHDALRLRFVPEDAGLGWRQELAGADGLPERVLERHDVRSLPLAAQAGAVTEIATRVQAGLDLGRGCLLAAAHIQLADDSRLLLVVHHLAVDGVSWRILLEDLQAGYAAACAGTPITLPPKTTSWRAWTIALAEQAQHAHVGAEAAHWLATARRGAHTGIAVDDLPEDADEPAALLTRADTRTEVRTLDAGRTVALLQQAPTSYGAGVDELLVAAAASALGTHLAGEELLLDIERHGRDPLRADVDVTRTVGWFTSMYPLLVRTAADPVHALRSVQRAGAEVPGQGLGFGMLRRLRTIDSAGAELVDLPRAAVSFNYLGRFDRSLDAARAWTPAPEPTGPGQDLRASRDYLLEIDAVVLDQSLQLTWTYSRRLHRAETIAAVADTALARLVELLGAHDAATAWRPAERLASDDFAADELGDLLSRFGAS